MKREFITCFAGAALCHLVLLFGFRAGTSARPLPAREVSAPVDVSLVPAAPEPMPEPPPQPSPEPAVVPTPAPPPLEPVPRLELPKPATRPPTAAIARPIRHASAVVPRENHSFTQSGPAMRARPRYRDNPPPDYPLEARRLRQEGVVLLVVEVGADGHPSRVHIKRGSGAPSLDQAAVDAVRRWFFEPARTGGLPVPSAVEVPVRFSLAR